MEIDDSNIFMKKLDEIKSKMIEGKNPSLKA
jgi:hypothetical protein